MTEQSAKDFLLGLGYYICPNLLLVPHDHVWRGWLREGHGFYRYCKFKGCDAKQIGKIVIVE